jgi:hypothetical protein
MFIINFTVRLILKIMLWALVGWPITVPIVYLITRGTLDGWENLDGHLGAAGILLFLGAFIESNISNYLNGRSTISPADGFEFEDTDMLSDYFDDDEIIMHNEDWVGGFTYTDSIILGLD